MAFILSCFFGAPSAGQHLEVRAKCCVGMCLPFPFTLATASHSYNFQVVAFILSIHGLGKRGAGGSGGGERRELEGKRRGEMGEAGNEVVLNMTRPSVRPPTCPARETHSAKRQRAGGNTTRNTMLFHSKN